jgi:hypothetical protein
MKRAVPVRAGWKPGAIHEVTSDGLGYEGTGILQTPLADGDIVHFFFDFPSTLFGDNYAANYVRGVFESYTSSDLTVLLQGHTTFIQPPDPHIMDIYNYVNLDLDPNEITARLYQADGVTFIAEGKVSGDEATFPGRGLVPGSTYILKTTPTYHEYDGDIDDAFFDLTGAYSEITIPSSQ